MNVRKLFHGHSLAASFALTLVASAALVACGGSSGSGGNTTTPTPVDGVITVVATPDGTTAVKQASILKVTYKVNTQLATATSSVACNGSNIPLTADMSTTPNTVTFTPATTLPASANCIWKGNATAVGLDGGKQGDAPWNIPFTVETPTCTAPQVYVSGIGACAYPMGVKVYGTQFNQLPAGCTSVTQQCWKDFVSAGKAAWVQTSALMTGSAGGRDTRPIIFPSFITPTGRYQTLTVFSDTGDLMNTAGDIDVQVIQGGIDFVIGNDQGYIFKIKDTGECLQWRWNPPTSTNGSTNVWNFASVTCPL